MALLSEIASAKWYHRFEVLPGVFTPGICPFDAARALDAQGVPADLGGLVALDVGTWDGPLAFELERRGAEVYALDVQHPDCTAFNLAKRLRQSKVTYVQGSVYDVNRLLGRKVDLITYYGVYYHLKHPILGFEALAAALRDDGRLYFEGELLLNYSEDAQGRPSTLDNRALAQTDVPLALCYTGMYKGCSNWFVPNLACLRGWLEAAGLVLQRHGFIADDNAPAYPAQRICGVALKSPHLEMIDEIPIFERDLAIPPQWHHRTEKLRSHRSRQTVNAGATGTGDAGTPSRAPYVARSWKNKIAQLLRLVRRGARQQTAAAVRGTKGEQHDA